MAVLDFNNISSTTLEKLVPKIVDNIFDYDPVLMTLLASAKSGSGTQLTVPVGYINPATDAGSWYSGMDPLNVARVETYTKAKFDWKQVNQNIVLSNIDKAKNSGKEAIIDLVAEKVKEAERAIQYRLSTALFGDGSDALQFPGLAAVCDDRTNVNVYGDINRTTDAFWRANYTAAVGELTTNAMGVMDNSCSSGPDRTTMIVTTEEVKQYYEQLLSPTQVANLNSEGYPTIRMTEDGKVVSARGKELGGDAGFVHLWFRGIPVVSSEYCQSGRMYFINDKHLAFYVMKHPKYKTDKYGFAMSDEQEPVDQDGTAKKIFWYGTLAADACRRFGQLRGITS